MRRWGCSRGADCCRGIQETWTLSSTPISSTALSGCRWSRRGLTSPTIYTRTGIHLEQHAHTTAYTPCQPRNTTVKPLTCRILGPLDWSLSLDTTSPNDWLDYAYTGSKLVYLAKGNLQALYKDELLEHKSRAGTMHRCAVPRDQKHNCLIETVGTHLDTCMEYTQFGLI